MLDRYRAHPASVVALITGLKTLLHGLFLLFSISKKTTWAAPLAASLLLHNLRQMQPITHFCFINMLLTSMYILSWVTFQIIKNNSGGATSVEPLRDASKQRLMKTGFALKCAVWLLTGHVLPTLISSRSNYARHKNLLSSAISELAFHSVWASFAPFMRGQNALLQSLAAAVFHNVISLPRNNGSCPEVCVMKAKPDRDWQPRMRRIKPRDARNHWSCLVGGRRPRRNDRFKGRRPHSTAIYISQRFIDRVRCPFQLYVQAKRTVW